ncbi:uncharacterized protein LOC142343879 isoform X2 [Convolutriloba macropyga]|uniref:uncharacterized protein LOC142343879 isoform X2 n=1 Tax=Convolutriloba macropyga TaxID=536237 RepID=UPI003F51E804
MRYDVGQNLSPTTLVKKPYINVVVFPISAADVLSNDNNLFSSVLSFSKFNTSQSSSFRRRRSNNDEDAVCGPSQTIQLILGSPVSIPCPFTEGSSSSSSSSSSSTSFRTDSMIKVDSRKWCVNNCDNSLNIRAESSDPSPAKSSDPRLTVVGDVLRISEATLDEVGTWECRMTFFNPDTSRNDRQSCMLKLIHIPKIVATSSSGGDNKRGGQDKFMLEEGDRFSYSCTAEAVDSADMLWISYSEDPRFNDVEGRPVSSDYDGGGGMYDIGGTRVKSTNQSPSSSSALAAQSSSSSSKQSKRFTPRYLIRKDKASMTTTLDIYPVQKEDQKYFVCQFRTGSGVATQVFKLTVKGKFSWVYPLVAIVLEIVIVTGVILFHEYRENKRRERQMLISKRNQHHLYMQSANNSTSHLHHNNQHHSSLLLNRPNTLTIGTQGSLMGGGWNTVGPVNSITHLRPVGTSGLNSTFGGGGGSGGGGRTATTTTIAATNTSLSTPTRTPPWTPGATNSPAESFFSSRFSQSHSILNPLAPQFRQSMRQRPTAPHNSNPSLTLVDFTGLPSSEESGSPLDIQNQNPKPITRSRNASNDNQSFKTMSLNRAQSFNDPLPPPPILPKPLPIPTPRRGSKPQHPPPRITPMTPGICFPVPQSAFLSPSPSPPYEEFIVSRVSESQQTLNPNRSEELLVDLNDSDQDATYIQC